MSRIVTVNVSISIRWQVLQVFGYKPWIPVFSLCSFSRFVSSLLDLFAFFGLAPWFPLAHLSYLLFKKSLHCIGFALWVQTLPYCGWQWVQHICRLNAMAITSLVVFRLLLKPEMSVTGSAGQSAGCILLRPRLSLTFHSIYNVVNGAPDICVAQTKQSPIKSWNVFAFHDSNLNRLQGGQRELKGVWESFARQMCLCVGRCCVCVCVAGGVREGYIKSKNAVLVSGEAYSQ